MYWDCVELQRDCFVAMAPRNDMHLFFLIPDYLSSYDYKFIHSNEVELYHNDM
jgi:hypothetical protein